MLAESLYASTSGAPALSHRRHRSKVSQRNLVIAFAFATSRTYVAAFLYPMRFGIGSCNVSVRYKITGRYLACATPFPHRQGCPTYREHLRAFKAMRKAIISISRHPISSEASVCIAKDVLCIEICAWGLGCRIAGCGFLSALQMATGDIHRTTHHG